MGILVTAVDLFMRPEEIMTSEHSRTRNRKDEDGDGADNHSSEQLECSAAAKKLAHAHTHHDRKKLENDSSSSDESDEEDDDLILEGVLVRNPDVESSSSEEDEEDKKPAAKRQKTTEERAASQSSSEARRQGRADEPDMVQVEFTFCDMNEKFFHGIKTLLHSSSTIYAPDSSALSDLMINNVSVGTVISTAEATDNDEEEANVYGFASVLNVSTNNSHPCIQRLKKLCLDKCPSERKVEMETVLSGKTKRPAGFLLHGRMINLPLEVVEVLHQQLVLDMDWAVDNAQGGEDERKSLDFGAFVRLAPASASSSSGGAGVDYKYFDDEVFDTNAEFAYTIDAPKQLGLEEKQVCQVLVMTKTGHRQAMKELAELVSAT